MKIAVIVEGDGEVKAVPLLIRRIVSETPQSVPFEIAKPIRVRRQRILLAGELERYLDLAAARAGEHGAILILLDANGDCPAVLGPEIRERAAKARPDRRIDVVLAKREYEAWFIAAAESLSGTRGMPPDLSVPEDPESVRGAKEWLKRRTRGSSRGSYSPTTDQAALTERFDMEAARRRSPSFDKMWRAVNGLLQ